MRRAAPGLAAALLSGCALLGGDAPTELLLALEVSRPDESTYRPIPRLLQLEQPGGLRARNVRVGPDATVAADGTELRLLRVAVDPGALRICGVSGSATAFGLTGRFHVPLLLDMDLAPGTATYAGRVTARLRPRAGDEFAAGPRLPVLEQRAAGFLAGTWDVTVEDRSAEDLALFRQRHPELAQAALAVAVPAHDREAVQAWAGAWDAYAESEYARAMQQVLGKPPPLRPAEARPAPPARCRGLDLR